MVLYSKHGAWGFMRPLIRNVNIGVPVMAQWLLNLTRNHEVAGLIPGLAQELRIWHCLCCGVGHRWGWDPELLWLWCRLVATAPI